MAGTAQESKTLPKLLGARARTTIASEGQSTVPPQGSDELGSLVSEYQEGDAKVKLYLHGFAIEQRGDSFRGPFHELALIYGEEAALPGARVRVVLPDRREFCLEASPAGAATLRGLLRMSAPVMVERANADFKAGRVVDFGGVRLSQERIHVRRALIGWRRLPLERLTGWMVRDGWLYLDAGGRRPVAFAEKPLDKIANLAALVALLTKTRAEADLSQPANSLRHAARASRWPWARPTALTRRPGPSPSRLAMVAGVWVTLSLIAFAASRHPTVARVGRRFIADLGEAVSRVFPR